MNLLRVAFAHQEDDGRRVRRRVVRQAFYPVFLNAPAFGDGVNVIGQRQRHHVGLDAVDHRGRLFAGTAVRLSHRHLVAGFRLIVLAECRVVSLIELTRRIV